MDHLDEEGTQAVERAEFLSTRSAARMQKAARVVVASLQLAPQPTTSYKLVATAVSG
jgi:hypothetical protein